MAKKTWDKDKKKSENPRAVPDEQASRKSKEAYERLQLEAKQKYQEKLTRREISQKFAQIIAQNKTPEMATIMEFLAEYSGRPDLLRTALDRYRNETGDRLKAVWELLKLSDIELVNKIDQDRRERSMEIENTKAVLQEYLTKPLALLVPVEKDGPNYHMISPEAVHLAITNNFSGEKLASFQISGNFPYRSTGKFPIVLTFNDSTKLEILIEVKLDLNTTEIPEDYKFDFEVFRGIEVQDDEELENHLKKLARQKVNIDQTSLNQCINLLKTAFLHGYYKTAEFESILSYYRYIKKNLRKEVSNPIQPEAVVNGENDDESEKFRILDLPSLVEHDLVNSTVDTNVLQRAFVIPALKYLNHLTLDEFTEDDIRLLVPNSQYWKISDLKKGRYGRTSVDSRTLAKIVLSIARLQFDRLDIGSCEAGIRFCLSSYSTLMGEYLVTQHGRYDLARDYYLAAISLNLTSQNSQDKADFPTILLFRSFPNDNRLPAIYEGQYQRGPAEFLELLEQPRWQSQEMHNNAVRSFLELGSRHFKWAARWFDECKPKLKNRLLAMMQTQLSLGNLADLSDCVNEYEQKMRMFTTLLRQMQECMSLHEVVQKHDQFENMIKNLSYLLSPTNQEMAKKLQKSIEYIEGLLVNNDYREQTGNGHAALQILQEVKSYGADNYTALWAEFLNLIASRWYKLVSDHIDRISKNIAPQIDICLAEERASLTEGEESPAQARVIFKVINRGQGMGERLSFSFSKTSAQVYYPFEQNYELDSGESFEDYFSLQVDECSKPFQLYYSGFCYDMDQKKIPFSSVQPLLVQPILDDNSKLKQLSGSNPFKTDHEVSDERMFVGRKELLEEVKAYAVNQEWGSLLMLHGQRRVGKSSLLLFLEKAIDQINPTEKILGVRVSWLDFAQHPVPALMEEIAVSIRNKCRSQFGINIIVPTREEFMKSYTLAFNDLLRNLADAEVFRLIILWDEFDGLVNHFDKAEMGYDRIFFEYLRGLSKRKSVTLILTGGELMPSLFDRWGEIFNHDKTWRISYLSSTDGSVEKLIRNDYVKEYLVFNNDAVERIKEYSACNPFFVQMICRELVTSSALKKSPHVCVLDVVETTRNLVHGILDSKYMRHLYSPRLSPDSLDMAVIGFVSAKESESKRNRFIPQDVVLTGIHHDEDELITRIGELVRREILQRNPNNNFEVKMKLPLFRDWFNANKPEYKLWASKLRGK
jgi:hypothetical protein